MNDALMRGFCIHTANFSCFFRVIIFYGYSKVEIFNYFSDANNFD